MSFRATSPDEAKPDTLLTAKEAQHCLGIGPTTLNKFVRLKWLSSVRFSKRLVRYRASEIDALIEKFSKKGGAQ
jgi:predicted DNA-binding transcriptional regulator AlpA